jgi:hypothetical protein
MPFRKVAAPPGEPHSEKEVLFLRPVEPPCYLKRVFLPPSGRVALRHLARLRIPLSEDDKVTR